MLRISKLESQSESGATLRIEGQLVGPWVEELRTVCDKATGKGKRVGLDCSGIVFADADGISLLRAVRHKGLRLLNCSRFIQLHLEESDAIG